MNASAGFGGRHTLHAVDAALIFQLAVHTPALDGGRRFLEATDASVAARHHVEFPALALGVLRIHAEQLAREQRSLVAAGARANFEHDVLLVVLVFRDEQNLEVGDECVSSRLQPFELFLRQFAHVGVARRRQLLGLLEVVHDGLVFAEPLDRRLDVRQRLGLLAILGRIALQFG